MTLQNYTSHRFSLMFNAPGVEYSLRFLSVANLKSLRDNRVERMEKKNSKIEMLISSKFMLEMR